MPHDAERVEETREWLEKSLRDLESAAVLLGSSPAYPDTALFHCQQAAEKAWKGFLVWHDVAFRKTHDLRGLGESCVRLDSSLGQIAEQAEQLTPFAWVFRYPGEPEIPSMREALDALALARRVFASVLERLPEDARPGDRG